MYAKVVEESIITEGDVVRAIQPSNTNSPAGNFPLRFSENRDMPSIIKTCDK